MCIINRNSEPESEPVVITAEKRTKIKILTRANTRKMRANICKMRANLISGTLRPDRYCFIVIDRTMFGGFGAQTIGFKSFGGIRCPFLCFPWIGLEAAAHLNMELEFYGPRILVIQKIPWTSML